MKKAKSDDLARVAERLRKLALQYPETYEEAPWGDRVVKVRGKIFFFCGARDGNLLVTAKLPASGRAVLTEKWAAPTGYGLGKSGWVTSTFGAGDAIPEARIAEWIGESYRALAPKKLAAAPPAPKKKPARLRGRVLVLTLDQLRAARAVEALAARGVAASSTDDVAAVRRQLAKLDAVVVDVGREPDIGLELVDEIDSSDHAVHIFVAGVRDAAMRRRVAAAGSAAPFRQPPGDAAVADAIAAAIAK